MYAEWVNRFSATRAGTWMVKHVAAHVDPVIFKASKGRWTMSGPPTLPQLALTTVGRRSGEPRTVQLAYVAEGEAFLVVASAMGQDRHPAWRHNLEAAGGGTVQLRGRTADVSARLLDDDEKAERWPAITAVIPQMTTYEQRTDRNIGVFVLTPRNGD